VANLSRKDASRRLQAQRALLLSQELPVLQLGRRKAARHLEQNFEEEGPATGALEGAVGPGEPAGHQPPQCVAGLGLCGQREDEWTPRLRRVERQQERVVVGR